MSVRLSIMMLLVLALVGCTGTPQYGGTAASSVAPVLGVVTDEKLQVVEVVSGGAAEHAGIQRGDILLDLTWIPTGTLEPLVTAIPSATPDLAIPSATLFPAVTSSPSETVIALPGPAGSIAMDTNGTPIEGSELLTPIAIPAPTIPPEQYIEREAVPFTDSTRISSLVGRGFPLKLRLQREGEILDITIIASTGVFHPLAPGEGTPTPIPDTYYYY